MKEQGDLTAFVREPIGVARAIPLDEVVGFHFVQVVSQLGERIRPLGDPNRLRTTIGGSSTLPMPIKPGGENESRKT